MTLLDKKKPSPWVQATRYSYLGLFFGCAIFIGYSGGAWADHRFHTAPWLMMVGVLLGIAASFKELFRLANQFRREERNQEKPETTP